MITKTEIDRRLNLWNEGYWEVPENLDTTEFNFDWKPDPCDRPYIHQFGTQHQSTGGPRFIIPEHEGVKYQDFQHAIRKPDINNRAWRPLLTNSTIDFSWHPPDTDPPYIYVFGNQWYDVDIMPTYQYRVAGATEKKFMYDVTAILLPDTSKWEIPDNIAIGRDAAATSTTGSNNITIGKFAQNSVNTASNEITLGNSSHTVLRCAVTTITSLSDERDKKEIKPLQVGTDFVKTLKPVEFIWDERDENGKHNIKDFGFIAQHLKRAQEDINLQDTLKLVYEENPDKLEASYGKLVPILVKAIQELTERLELIEKKQ